MYIRKFLVIIFLLFSIYNTLNADINFEINYSLPINYDFGIVKNIQLVDINNDGIDEISVDQLNESSGHTTIFSQSGQILSEFIHSNDNNEKFVKSFIYQENSNCFLVCSSSYKPQYPDDLYLQLKTYDLMESTLIDSSRTFLFPEGELNNVHNINIVDTGDDKILYLGIQHYNFISDELIIYKSYLIRYYFDEGISNYIDTIEDCGLSFQYYNWSNLILTIGYEFIDTFDGYLQIVTKNYYFNSISNEINYQFDIITEISGNFHSSETGTTYHDYPYTYRIITNNDLHQQDYGSILYYELKHSPSNYEPFIICYSPNLDEILWESQEARLNIGSCINPTDEFQENYYLIDINNGQNSLRIINRMNGDMIIEQDCPIDCNKIIRSADNRIYFFDITNTEINVYSIVGEIVQNSQNVIIDSYVNSISNFPNPFNPTTAIEFSIQNNSKVELSIYNIKGQKIKTLTNNEFTKGSHLIVWNGDDESGKSMGSGIYLYKLNVNNKAIAVKKCLLLK